MTTTEPLVSVVLPTFDAMAYLPNAVQSVLDQTVDDWELLVIDDGSTDETPRYLSGLRDGRVRLIRLEHTGNQSRVRNTGIQHARGRYVAFLDSDDAWMPQKLEIQIAGLQASPACRWSYTAVVRIDEAGAPLPFNPRVQPWIPYDGWILERLLRVEAQVATPAVVVERQLLEEVGSFDAALLYCQQYDLWFRLALRSPVCVHTEPLACIRIHTANYSSNRLGVHESWAALYHKTAALMTDPRLRKLCTMRRVAHVATVARIHTGRREERLALRTLFGAFPFAWHYAEWWRALGRAVVRPLVPDRVVAATRELRSRRAPRMPA